MIQTYAIFKDAYRELNAKRLFWIVVGVSVLVVALFAIIGNNDRGLTILGYTIEVPFLSTRAVSSAGFYKFVFSTIGVNFWLTWGATILALISTAGMIPDFVASGSIDMALCKPIGRLRLFLTKYAAGLLFVALPVLVFSAGAFLVIGIRGKSWEPSLFLAVPIVLVCFSYLFCVCALVGIVTRSGITALLVTLVFWVLIWVLNATEVQLLQLKLNSKRDMDRDQTQITLVQQGVEMLKDRLEVLNAATRGPAATPKAEPSAVPPIASPPIEVVTTPEGLSNESSGPKSDNPPRRGRARRDWERLSTLTERIRKSMQPTDDPAEVSRRIVEQETQLENLRNTALENAESFKSLSRWQQGLFAAKTLLPKTGETADLLKRYVIDKEDREGILQMIEDTSGETSPKDVRAVLDSRTIGWVAGTSLAFEFVILSLASWIFCRRDF